MSKFSRIMAMLLCVAMLMTMLPTVSFAVAVEDTPTEPAEPAIPIYEDTSYSFAERAADLVARMNLRQKASQMINNTPAIAASQLGGGALNVPATKNLNRYTWWSETLHGCGGGVNYPQNTTVASTWNTDLYRQEAINIGQEIRERNMSNLNFYSPTVNMHRDPRWGRNEESYSEDVFLTSQMGSQFILGMEGKNDDGTMIDPDGYYNLHTTIKHYVANNNEGKNSSDPTGRLRSGAVSSLRMLREYYAAPYGEIIRNANVSSVMTAYNSFNGDPTSYSSYLMDTLLRQIYGLQGYITSDCDSVASMQNLDYTNQYTGKPLTAVEALAGALSHGEDLECNGGHSSSGSGTSGFHTDYNAQINNMIEQAPETDKGIFTENTVDISVHRLMTARIQTGEFDGNIKIKQDAAERSSNATALRAERQALVDTINAEGVVMLQNKGILPLDLSENGVQKVVIVGAWQTNGYTGLYSQASRNQTNIQAGITNALKAKKADINIVTIPSNNLTDANKEDIQSADAVIVVVGTPQNYSREDGDRASIALPDNLDVLISNVGKLNPNTIAVMETCGPMQVTKFQNDVNAILWSSYGGQWKTGFGAIISGAANPSGKTTDTWYQNVSDTGESDVPAVTDYDLVPSEGKNGRTYMYYNGENEPSYVFGFGLSYTTFAYSNLKIDKTSYDANETVKVSFDVTNTGSVAGKEATQLYIAQPDAPAELQRPIKRLKGFEKIELQPGETKTVEMEVAIPDLVYYNEAKDCMEVDTGKYQVQVGTNSKAAADLTVDFTVTGALDEYPVLLTVKANQAGDSENGIEQRLIYGKNQVVNPQVTVSMNNEKLYGYIIANQNSLIKSLKSTPLPEGMVISYSSNRPNVVKVEGDKVVTVGPGVATLTVTATYEGKTVSGEAVIYVMSPTEVDEITVDGQPLEKFAPKKYSYSMKLESKKHIPVVAATSSNPDLDIVVTQATELPGVATVVSTDRESGVSSTYTITFKVKASNVGGYILADTVEAGKQYVIVSNGYALTNEVADVSTAYGGVSLASTAVTVENDMITSEVTPDMIWDFSEGTSTSNNGFETGYFLTNGDSKFLSRNGPTNGNPAPLNTQTYDASNVATKPQFCYWVVKDLDDEGNKAVFVTGTGEWSFALRGAADGFDAPGNSNADTIAAANPVKLYEVVAAPSLPSIDFTNPEDAVKFDIVNQSTAAIKDGTGLTLTTTRPAFEPCNGQNSGDQATTPEDVIMVPVVGDWEATLEFDFSTGSARNGYYQFFGFYASEGDDFQNMAGIRGGDGAMQNFLRVEGDITADSAELNSAPGLATAGTYWYRITKEGTTYICARSSDGDEFTEMFRYEDTGIEAEYIVIDAYTGMTEGYQFTLKSLIFEGSQPVVKDKPEISAITVDGKEISFDPSVKAYNFEVAKDSTKAPVIAATAGNASTKVEIQQLEGPTGTAYVTGTVDNRSVSYSLSFNYSPQNDYFADGNYDASIWTILNKDESAFRVEAGKGIVLPTQLNDIYQNGTGWKNCFVSPAMGNWEVVAKVVFPVRPTENYQQAMFLLWQDEDNYIRLNCQNTGENLVVEPGRENNGTFTPNATATVQAAADNSVTMYFKLKKNGDSFTGAFSQNGTDYTEVYTADGLNYVNPQIAMFASKNQDGDQIDANFEYVYVVAREGLQPEYTEMLHWAAQNAADYIAAALPTTASENLTLAAAPHGYTVTLESSDPAVIAADGTVTPAAIDKQVDVTVWVTEGDVTASAKAVTITVPAGEPSDELAIVTQPESYVGAVGSTATFHVEANGEGLTYQWYYSNNGGKNFAKSMLRGSTTDTLPVAMSAYRDGQQYKCVVTDATGATVETVVVTMHVTVPAEELAIVSNPENFTGAVGETATFTVEATGEGLTYQWYYSNNNGKSFTKSTLPGATTASVEVVYKAFRAGQQYKCVVTDISGNVVESTAASIVG